MKATVIRVFGMLGLALALMPRAAEAADGLARLTHLEGEVILHRAYVTSPAYSGAPLDDGDEVQTTAGRAEIAFKDGSLLHLDRDTRVVVYERQRFFVIDGRVFFRSTTLSPQGYEAQTDIGRLRVLPRGVYGILADRKHRQILVSVAIGEAQVESPWGHTRIMSSQMALVSGATGRPYVTPFFPWRADSFETWSSSRVLAATLSPSSRSHPSALDTTGPVIDHYRESTPTTLVWPRYSNGYHRGRGVTPGEYSHAPYAPRPHTRPPTPPPSHVIERPAPPKPAPRPPVVIDGAAVGRTAQPPPRS